MVLGCVDESGAAIDGYTILKKDDGYQYFVYNPSKATFELSPYSLDQTTDGAIMKTLAPLYDKNVNESIAMAFYNDDPPVSSKSSSYAHAKGVLATDSNQGFWLVHSMPNWPMSSQGPDGAGNPGILPNDDYGQSFRCVTVSQSTVENIAQTLRVDDPLVYGGYIPASMKQTLPSMQLMIDKDQRKDVNNTVTTFSTVGGTPYTQFAKSKIWDKDLYDDLIAPYYGTALFVETWIKGGGGRQSSICNTSQTTKHPKVQPYDIFQVDLVKMPNGDSWKNTEDHSKYCISTQSDDKVTCVGDVNRMCSQERRGGGALCVDDEGLHTAFTEIVNSVEACYSEDPCVSWDCYYCSETRGPTSAPTYALPVSPPSFSPSAKSYPSLFPTPVPSMLTISPTTSNGTSPSDFDNGGGSIEVGVVIGVACGLISLVICAFTYYVYRNKQTEMNRSKAWLSPGRTISRMRNSLDGRNWLTDELTGGHGSKAPSVRSSLDGGSTFGDYLPPNQDKKGQSGADTTVTITSMDERGVVNPLNATL